MKTRRIMVPIKESNGKIVAVRVPKVPDYVVEAARMRMRLKVKVHPLNLRRRKEDEGGSMGKQKARASHYLVTIIEEAACARLTSYRKLPFSPKFRHSSGVMFKRSA